MSIISGPGISGKRIPPGFVGACGACSTSAYNVADNCKQVTQLCVDSAAVLPEDFIELRVSTNANWCGQPYYNCHNGYQNSYCGEMRFRYEQPLEPAWTGACVASEVYKMLMSDQRLSGILHMELDPISGCLVLTSRNPYWVFTLEIITSVGFVAVVTEVSPPSLSAEIPYGYVVTKAPMDCSEPERVAMLPTEEDFAFYGIAFRCHELYESCENGSNGQAVEKTCERFYYKPGEKVHILQCGEIWVPLAQIPTATSNKLSYTLVGNRGLIIPSPYQDPSPVGTIELPNSKLLDFNPSYNLALIQIKNV